MPVSDKALHFIAFFLLTVVFYWVVDTSRRRTLNLTLTVCTAVLGLGSELLQAVLPNGRTFDIFDVVANVAGSLAGVALCTWYHKRMLERRRAARGYGAVPRGDAEAEDLELGEGVGGGPDATAQDEGITTVGTSVLPGGPEDGPAVIPAPAAPSSTTKADPAPVKSRSIEEEVDNWDENAEDPWDEDDDGDIGATTAATGNGKDAANGSGNVEPKKHSD